MGAKKTIICECGNCNGTGVYVGWNCHDGAGTVCDKCNGNGSIEISYIPFTGKKKREGIKRIFANVRWRHVYPEAHQFDNGTTVDFSKYGCTYEEWERGVEPKPIP